MKTCNSKDFVIAKRPAVRTLCIWLLSILALLTLQTVPIRSAQAQTPVRDLFRIDNPKPASGNEKNKTLSADLASGSATAGNQEGSALGLRYTESDAKQSNSVEYRRQSRFNETGQQLALQQTRSLNSLQRITLAANVSDSFLFARAGVASVFEQTWLDPRVGATRIGLSWQNMRNAKDQTSVSAEQTGRLPNQVVWQLGRQQGLAVGNGPSFHTHYLALQYLGADGWRITARKQWSREAFQAISDTQSRVNFASQGLRLSLGLQVRQQTWINLFHERYDTPFYERRQIGVGVDQSW